MTSKPLAILRTSCVRHLAGLITLALLASPHPGHAEAPAETSSQDLSPLASDLLPWLESERTSRNIPGLAFALIEAGEVTWVGGFGLADIESARSVEATTVFRVGSVSKPVTATAALALVAEGRLTLEEDLRPLLQDLPIRPPLEEPLTLHHLLTHTCGFDERLFGQHVRSEEHMLDLEGFLKTRLTPRFERPGQVIAYNDHCTALAGLVIERLGGRAFESEVERRVLAPLGMTHASFDQKRDHRQATSYRWTGSEAQPYPRDYIMTTPAAGLFASAADMASYLHFLLGEGDARVLPDLLRRKQMSVQFTHHEALNGRAYGFASMRHKDLEVFYKDGQASGFAARLVLVPETGDGFFIALNRSILGPLGAPNEAGRLPRALTARFLETKFADRAEPGKEPQRIWQDTAAADLSRYAGVYRNTVASRHTFERVVGITDDIVVKAPEPGHLTLFGADFVPVGPDLFQVKEGQTFVAFEGSDTAPRYLFVGGGSYERVPQVTGTPWLARLGLAFAVLYGLTTAVGLWQAWVERGWRRLPGGLILSAQLKLVFLAGFALSLYLTDTQVWFFGATPLLKGLLVLPLAALLLDLVLLLRAWQRPLVALCLLAFTPFYAWLFYWNLLGWHFG